MVFGLANRGGPASRQSDALARANQRDELFDERFVRSLEQLHLVSRRIAAGSAMAQRRTRKLGSGIEFADHRQYAPGDDFRYVDWNLYGRLDKLLLRLFEEEEDLSISFLIDVSDSMLLGAPPKVHYAMQVAAALGYVGLANLDRIAMLPFAGSLGERMPPTRGKKRIFHAFEFLRTCALGGQTNLAAVTKSFVRQANRRGMVVVISDFFDHQGVEAALNTLRYHRFEPFLLQVVDPREPRPTLRGDLVVVDAETGEVQDVTVSADMLARYERAFLAHTDGIRRYATSRSIPFFRAATDVPFDELIMRIFRQGGFLR